MKFTLVILLVILFLNACGGGSDSSTTPSTSISSFNTSSNASLTVFFSKPAETVSNNDTHGPEANLINAINKANTSIDMAIYELSLDTITQSLLAAHQRNITVRVLTDSDHLHWDAFQTLINAGIAVKGDERSALMHNKFTLIDQNEVWTGSMNLTYSAAYRNHENLVRVNHRQAALNYSEEFDQLWVGIHNQANAIGNSMLIDNTPVDIHFSPDDHFRETRLLPLLKQATRSVHIMAFAFTSEAIATELLQLKAKGVEIKIVVDKGQSGQTSSQYDDLLAQQVDIVQDGHTYKLHHKVMIIDQRYVVTGSYNFSQNAESRNDENSLVIDSPTLAQQFEAEFNAIYSQGINQ